MSTLDPNAAAPTMPVADPPIDAAAPVAPAAPIETQAEIETRARAQGWRPKEEFNKAPETWKPADEFLSVAEESLPMMRERLRNMSETVAKIPAIEKALKFSKQEREHALKTQREELQADYDAKMRAAAETGNLAEFDRLAAEKTAKTKETVPVVEPEAVTNFKADNVWYGTNEEMTDFANATCLSVERDHPDWGPVEVMRRTGALVQKAYPGEFAAPVSSVEAGGRRITPAGSAQTFDAMPADMKAAFQVSTDAGLVEDTEEGKKIFAQFYWEAEGEQ